MPSDFISIPPSLTWQSVIKNELSKNASQHSPSFFPENIEQISNKSDRLQSSVDNKNIAIKTKDLIAVHINLEETSGQKNSILSFDTQQPPISEEELKEFFSQEGWQLAMHEIKQSLAPEEHLILAELKKEDYSPGTTTLLTGQTSQHLPKDQHLSDKTATYKRARPTEQLPSQSVADTPTSGYQIKLRERLLRAPHPKETPYKPTTKEILLAWQANQKLPESSRLSREQFSQEKKISPDHLDRMLKKDGSSSIAGEITITHKTEKKYKPITIEILFAWQSNLLLPQDKRLSRAEFVQTHRISACSLHHHIGSDGTFKNRGDQLMYRLHGHSFNKFTKAILSAWQENQKLLGHKHLSHEQFAEMHNISLVNLRNYIDPTGNPTKLALQRFRKK